jgi:hypothetical protein
MTSTAPEVTVTSELPTNAFIIIERPGQEPEVFAGSDAASAEALTYCSDAVPPA